MKITKREIKAMTGLEKGRLLKLLVNNSHVIVTGMYGANEAITGNDIKIAKTNKDWGLKTEAGETILIHTSISTG